MPAPDTGESGASIACSFGCGPAAAVVLTGAMSGTGRTYASPAAIFADASASAALTAFR